MGGTAAKIQSTEAFIDGLLAENQALKDQIDVLKDALAAQMVLPFEWGLTFSESAVFRVLLKRDLATKDSIMAALYSDRVNPPDVKIIDQFLCKMRRKLKRHGVEIQTRWGEGWSLDAETRARFTERRVA